MSEYNYLAPDFKTFKQLRHVILEAHDGIEGSAGHAYSAYNYEHYNGGQEWDDNEATLIEELFRRTLYRRFATWEANYGYDGEVPEGTSEAYWEAYVRDVNAAVDDFEDEWFTVGNFKKVPQSFLDDLFPGFRRFCTDLQKKQADARYRANLVKVNYEGEEYAIVGKPYLCWDGDSGMDFSDEEIESLGVEGAAYGVSGSVVVEVLEKDGGHTYLHYGQTSGIFDKDGNMLHDEPTIKEALAGFDYPSEPMWVGGVGW